MALAYINDTLVKFINEPELSDMLSPNGLSFHLVIFNNLTRFIGGRVEIKDNDGNLMASGHVKSENLKIGVRVYTTLEVIDPTWYLEANPFSYNANGTFTNTLDFLLLLSGVDYALTAFRYKTANDILTSQCNFSMQNETLKQGIQKAIDCTGFPLIFHIPLGENVIEIVQQGYGDNAPLPVIDLADLYTNCSLGIYDINTTKIPPQFSRIDVRGRNGDKITSSGLTIPLDQRRVISVGNSQYELFRNADEIIKFLVTQPTPPVVGCNVITVISGSNYTENNSVGLYDFILPNTASNPVSLIYTANISSIKLGSNVSYFYNGVVDTVEGDISITVDGSTIYTGTLTAAGFDQTVVNSLSAYVDTDKEVIITVTLDPQPSTNTAYNLILVVDCCMINTYIGTGTQGFNGDGLDRLSTDLYSPIKVRKDSDGLIYFSDANNNRIRRVKADNTVETVVGSGNGAISPTVDGGVATAQDLGRTTDFIISGDNLYLIVLDQDPPEIARVILSTGLYYKIDTDFIVTQDVPLGMELDSLGNLYYLNGTQHVLYKLSDPDGTPSRSIICGTYGTSGSSGDGGLATSALLNFPADIAIDGNDNILIVDGANGKIRTIDNSTGFIDTSIGGGSNQSFDIAPLDFQFDYPFSISRDVNTNDYYILDAVKHYVVKLEATTNLIRNFAGISAKGAGFTGDTGSPLTALLNVAGNGLGARITCFSFDEIWIADNLNDRVRLITCETTPNCPTDYDITYISNSITNGIWGTENIQPKVFSVNAGILGGNTSWQGTREYSIDLTSPLLSGHMPYASNFPEFSINSSATTFDAILTLTIKINGVTVYTHSQTESKSSGQDSTFTPTNFDIDLTSYIGSIINYSFEFAGSIMVTSGTGTASSAFAIAVIVKC